MSGPARVSASDCAYPGNVNHAVNGGKGTPEQAVYAPGATVEYACEAGYAIVGSARIECVSSGWRPSLPECAGAGCGHVTVLCHSHFLQDEAHAPSAGQTASALAHTRDLARHGAF